MKILEYHYGNNWWDKFNNFIAVPTEWIRSVAVAIDNEGIWYPGTESNFFNGAVFIRFTWPLGFYLQLRFGKYRFQTGLGWKVNGRFAGTFRIHKDSDTPSGIRGLNHGQAQGYNRGTA